MSQKIGSLFTFSVLQCPVHAHPNAGLKNTTLNKFNY